MRRRVGLLGGSFDPVHRAHVEIARRAVHHLDLHQVRFLPAVVSLHKQHTPPTAAAHRVQMLEFALADHPDLVLDARELPHGTARASADTVEEIAAAQPTWDLWFLMGQDALRSLPRWVRPEALTRACRLGVFAREGPSVDPMPGARVDWIPGPRLAVSSRVIRDQVARGQATPDLEPVVRAYIDEHRLYREADAS